MRTSAENDLARGDGSGCLPAGTGIFLHPLGVVVCHTRTPPQLSPHALYEAPRRLANRLPRHGLPLQSSAPNKAQCSNGGNVTQPANSRQCHSPRIAWAPNEIVSSAGDLKMKCDHLESMTVRQLGDSSVERGARPSVLLAEYELQREPSERKA